MLFPRKVCVSALVVLTQLLHGHAASLPAVSTLKHRRDHTANDLVTWDSNSIFVNKERLMIFSGEFHPFRLPVPGLWLDIFQKVKAMGFTSVSFYIDWALLEGSPGTLRMEGVFDLEPFFKAATEAGLYLIARPGPYINSEVSGGGFPGWVQRVKGVLRTSSPDFLNATEIYLKGIAETISKYQITKGGPVIMLQPENEYTICADYTLSCLEKEYMQFVQDQYRDGGIEVPFSSNDVVSIGNFAPGTGKGAVDIYGVDFYPFGWGPLCKTPSNWDRNQNGLPSLSLNETTHEAVSPSTPFMVSEFQGGGSDPWGGVGTYQCAALLNEEFERVFFKSLYSVGTKVLNIYMIYGGTNWGNLGHPLGYTSYDLGSAITEDRQVFREKYSEAKLEAHFLRVSPAYLTSKPQNTSYERDIVVNPLIDSATGTGFYVIRHNNYTANIPSSYKWKASTSSGSVSVPQIKGALTLSGRDSKIHVTNYDLGGIRLIYSSAEIFSWARYGKKSVLIIYGGEGETHEFAVPAALPKPSIIEGESEGIVIEERNSSIVVNWNVIPTRRTISFGGELEVLLLWRNDAYNYWVVNSTLATSSTPFQRGSPLIVRGGYLIRNASISDGTIHLVGDVNSTTAVEIIAAPVASASHISFNGEPLDTKIRMKDRLSAVIKYKKPHIHALDLGTLKWKYIDSLPEIKSYDDGLWRKCNLTSSNNPRKITTPTSLYASDYGFHAGSLIYRGRFIANGQEDTFSIMTQGGNAFAHSVYLESTPLGHWSGSPSSAFHSQTFSLPQLQNGSQYDLSVVIDHMGLDMNFFVDSDQMKTPRGILNYTLSGHPEQSDISWKITGNLGGEDYEDLSRGPLNEGSFFAERQGYHLPGAPTRLWETRSPISQGLEKAGVGFFATSFRLDIPLGWDIPMSFKFSNTLSSQNYRCQLFVNGWQFGKFVNNIGPQLDFPVPEGILNYNGPNYVSLTLWAQDSSGAKVEGLKLQPVAFIKSGYRKPELSSSQLWSQRENAY